MYCEHHYNRCECVTATCYTPNYTLMSLCYCYLHALSKLILNAPKTRLVYSDLNSDMKYDERLL